jgi:hypothetical protein
VGTFTISIVLQQAGKRLVAQNICEVSNLFFTGLVLGKLQRSLHQSLQFRIAKMWAVLLCLIFASAEVGALRIVTSGGGVLKGNASSKLSATTKVSKGDIGWDSHRAVQSTPESLVKEIGGNANMRSKFEALCRASQVADHCSEVLRKLC